MVRSLVAMHTGSPFSAHGPRTSSDWPRIRTVLMKQAKHVSAIRVETSPRSALVQQVTGSRVVYYVVKVDLNVNSLT